MTAEKAADSTFLTLHSLRTGIHIVSRKSIYSSIVYSWQSLDGDKQHPANNVMNAA